MDFTNLKRHYHKLVDYLEKEGYTKRFIQCVHYNIKWILKNEKNKSWNSYIDIYFDRISKSESEFYKRNQKLAFSTIQQFDIYNDYPNRKIKNCFIQRSAYYKLNQEFKELIDFYKDYAICQGLKKQTIYVNVSAASCFFYFMQTKGLKIFEDITEEHVLSFFLDNQKKISKSSSYKKNCICFKSRSKLESK